MNNEEEKKVRGIASVASSLLDDDVKSYISLWFFILTPFFFILLLYGSYNFATSFKSKLQNCWDVKVINNKPFKFNTCTGEVKKIHPNEIAEKKYHKQ